MQIKEKVGESPKDLYLLLLQEGKSIYLNAWGMSMYPFIKNGDRIKIEPVDEKEIKIGDVVAVDMKTKNEPWFFVHRVVKIAGSNGRRIYFTKGDLHKKGLDKPAAIESIAGKVTQIQRKGIEIDLKRPLWRCRWRLFLLRVKNRLRKGDPLLYNTEELLLICARKDLDEDKKKKAIDLIKEGLYWERFTESAVRGGVTILVYDTLKAMVPYVHIPQSVFGRLNSGYLFIVSKIASQHKELMGLLKLFAKKNVPVLALKGILLSRRLYGDAAARGLSADFDLLIEEKDKERARILLEEAGYSFDSNNEIRLWHYDFFKPKAMMIDLQWDITMMGRSEERIEGFWRGKRPAEEDGISYYEFKEEELLLYLSVHLVNSSRFSQLRYVCDINELLRKYKDRLNWNDIMEKAKKWRLSNSLYAALKLSKELLNSDLPPEVLKKLKPNFLSLILIESFADKKVILRNCLRKTFINRFLSYIFFEIIEARSPSEYLAIIKRVLFPPKEALVNTKYDDSKPLFIRYIIRLFKGTFKILGIKWFHR